MRSAGSTLKERTTRSLSATLSRSTTITGPAMPREVTLGAKSQPQEKVALRSRERWTASSISDSGGIGAPLRNIS